jgi:hypothetical protein
MHYVHCSDMYIQVYAMWVGFQMLCSYSAYIRTAASRDAGAARGAGKTQAVTCYFSFVAARDRDDYKMRT